MNILNGFDSYENYNIKKYNTYKLDVTCKALVFVKSVEELINLLKILKDNKIKYLILGNGSNVIFKDSYYDGVIIKLDKLNKLKIEGDLAYVEAGYPLMKLAKDVLNFDLTGLEFAAGIPGLLGSSIAMNAGAYNKDMASLVEEVTVLDENLELKKITKENLEFNYRDSLLKKNKNYICVSAVLKLEHGNILEAKNLIETRKEKRKETQPLEYPSAGSVFRNPKDMYAGELIEKCDLKGFNINGAEVSVKHANFIINKNNCEGKDIIKLIEIIKEKVYEKYHINLILEQEII